MSILIKNVLVGGRVRNIYIEGNIIEAISECSKEQVAEFVIDDTIARLCR